MKNFIKNNLKVFVTMIITTIIVGSVSVYAASQYFAKDISFTPTNENFKKENGEAITNVEDALNELYKKSNNIFFNFKKSIAPISENSSIDGIASTNSLLGSSKLYFAFDGNNNNGIDSKVYHSADYVFPNSDGIFVRFEFNEIKKIYYAIWYGRGISYNSTYYQTPSEYKFQASNNGIDWIDLTEKLTNDKNEKGLIVNVKFTKNVDFYKYYQMIVYDTNDSSFHSLALDEIEYYEKKYE